MMGFLTRFFGGMTIQGYVITFLVTVTLSLVLALGWSNHTKNELRTELGASEQAIAQMIETLGENRRTINELANEVDRCVNAREAAELSALEASKKLHQIAVERDRKQNEREKAITEEIESSDPRCDCAVPPGATRLLIDAACSANRDANCP